MAFMLAYALIVALLTLSIERIAMEIVWNDGPISRRVALIARELRVRIAWARFTYYRARAKREG